MPDRMPNKDRLSEYMSDRWSEYVKYMSKYVLTCHGGDRTK